ncbi:hypothetical protein [Fluviicola sp.]|uniref:hypothetical protein n=1 Tax=Fluviicola sp. TaxID=1917219 RepID=UPI00260C4A84|nr:hypothetical protein [Fluviicola sp.]
MKKILNHSLLSLFLCASITHFCNAQSTLAVNCYDTETPFNSVSLDEHVVEYGLVTPEPGFYVAVFDQSSCTAWGTNYNGANPDHSFGNYNEANGRPRVEYYFFFKYSDSTQLAGMLNMLQQIPAGHAIVIYTPISYDYAAVNAVNSNLTQELKNRWNPGVIEGNQIMILFGEQGSANSYVEETTLSVQQVSFSTTICGHLAVDESLLSSKLFVKKAGRTFELNPELGIQELGIFDAMGKQISFTQAGNTLQFSEKLSEGIYLFRGRAGGKMFQSKQLISF